MKRSPIKSVATYAIVFVVATAAYFVLSDYESKKFPSLQEHVSYCQEKFEEYCHVWEDLNGWNDGPPSGGFQYYSPECHTDEIKFTDGAIVCIAYEEAERSGAY